MRALRVLRGEIFHIDFRANKAYWWLIAERGLFLLGIYGVQAFAQYYLQDVIRVADPPKQTGDLLAVLTLSLVALVLVGGWLTDQFGAKRILYIASFLAAGRDALDDGAARHARTDALRRRAGRRHRTVPDGQLGAGKQVSTRR